LKRLRALAFGALLSSIFQNTKKAFITAKSEMTIENNIFKKWNLEIIKQKADIAALIKATIKVLSCKSATKYGAL
jgi:hypothetical protein